MNLINILTGIRLKILTKLLLKNGFSFRPRYFIRLFPLFVNALISSVLSLVEKGKYARVIRQTTISLPPVFIIGHWRTGSTYLHQLFNLDNQFTTPSQLQTAIPDHFLFSTKYYGPIMSRMMPKTRPMDQVPISPYEPQEDEFALVRLGSESPLEKIIFPEKNRYFLSDYQAYTPEGDKLATWKQNIQYFYKKMTYLTGKQIVSKNPAHTMRMALLMETFPGAKFIHITRNPIDVVPSTISMWNIIAGQNRLKKTWVKPEPGEVAAVLKTFLKCVASEKKNCGPHQFTEASFENLEKDPVKELKRIYCDLNLAFSADFEKAVRNFIATTKNYKKNTYVLTEKEKNRILEKLA